ncbi:uncharacterized protein LOC124909708 [Impatiens glandulifera]|uniref:uncharacterized protein LOC124909708 n=1 Tax=Impatiens glandulifera TaxID=253017 RepID=UPI001FB0D078|nr:uncharacterized protein LOC124909708 [Impatiens glandulifera]
MADIELKTFEAACQILSATKESIKVSGSKSTLKPEYIPICDIFARAILARGGNYSSLTKDKIRMLVGLIEGTKVNWAKAVFHNLMEMVKPDSNRSWGYVVPLGKIFLHHNLNIGPGVTVSSRSLIRSKQFLERKQLAPSSTSGRKKATGKKTAPAKEKVESKGKEKSPDNADPNANPETTEGGEEGGEEDGEEGGDEGGHERGNNEEKENEEAEADRVTLKVLKGTIQRAETIEELYLEWHEHRFGKPYRQILPGYTDVECLHRLKRVEVVIMDLTKFNTIEEVLHRTYLLKPQAQLRKLTIRIRKITAKFEEMGPEDTLTPLVLERLEKAKGDLIQEIDRLEAMYGQREIPVYTTPRIDTSPDHCPTPPRANSATEESDERADPNLTGQSPLTQPEVSESDFTKEWVESRFQEFEDSEVLPLKEKFQRTVSSALKFANTTRYLLDRTHDRFSEIDEDQQEEAALRGKHLKRTVILEDTTSELKENFDRLKREIDQRLTTMADDLVGTTLGRASELEKKIAGLEDELKALSAQVAELLQAKINADAAAIEADAQAAKKVQDELDAKASKETEAPRPSQLTEEEEEAERIRRAEAKFPGLAKKAAAQAAKDAARLERERRRLEGFADDNKKKKAASSVSAPTKRKREPSKKAQIADLLNEVTETVIGSTPQQVPQVDEEDEEHLKPRKNINVNNSITNSPSPHPSGNVPLANSPGAPPPSTVVSSIRIETNVPCLEIILRKRTRNGGDMGVGPSVPPQLSATVPQTAAAATVAFICCICK